MSVYVCVRVRARVLIAEMEKYPFFEECLYNASFEVK